MFSIRTLKASQQLVIQTVIRHRGCHSPCYVFCICLLAANKDLNANKLSWAINPHSPSFVLKCKNQMKMPMDAVYILQRAYLEYLALDSSCVKFHAIPTFFGEKEKTCKTKKMRISRVNFGKMNFGIEI